MDGLNAELNRRLMKLPEFKAEMEQLLKMKNVNSKRTQRHLYLGQMMNDKRQGRGLMITLENNRIYLGDWENDLKHGQGMERFANNAVYTGQYMNGKAEGIGMYQWSNGEQYTGEWVNGMKHGHGTWKGKKGDSYVGQWQFGKPSGTGTHASASGDRYTGGFLHSVKHGQGQEVFANGDIYVGQYENGKPEGQGTYKWKNGSSYVGMFKNGLRHGSGIWTASEKVPTDQYEGAYVNDKKSGQGTFKWASGALYVGSYFNDHRQGYGEMVWPNGKTYKGQWENGMQCTQQPRREEMKTEHRDQDEYRMPVLHQKVKTAESPRRTEQSPKAYRLSSNLHYLSKPSSKQSSFDFPPVQQTRGGTRTRSTKASTKADFDESDFSHIDKQVEMILGQFTTTQLFTEKRLSLQQKIKPWVPGGVKKR